MYGSLTVCQISETARLTMGDNVDPCPAMIFPLQVVIREIRRRHSPRGKHDVLLRGVKFVLEDQGNAFFA